MVWFGLLVFNDTFSTNKLHRVIGVWNIYCVGPWGTNRNIDKPNKNTHKHALPPGLCGGNLLTTLRCPQRGLSSQSLGKYWQLNQMKKHTSTYSRTQQQSKNPYYATIHNEYAQEKSQDKSTGQTEGHVPWICLPQGDLPAVHSRYTHTQKQCTARGSSWGSSIPVSDHWRLLDPPSGRVAKPLVSPLTPVPPTHRKIRVEKRYSSFT